MQMHNPYHLCNPEYVIYVHAKSPKNMQFYMHRIGKIIQENRSCLLALTLLTTRSTGFMSTGFDEEGHNGFVSNVFTSIFSLMSILTLTFDL